MLSLKDTLRKLIVTATLAAVTTHFFTGCSNTPVTSSDLYAPELTYEIEAPPLTYEANPGINSIEATDSDSFSIKYKYWYDNPEVKEAQEQSLAETNASPGSLTDKDFLNLPNLPIYRDSGGNEYIISGRTKVYLSNGKISSNDMFKGLRTEITGERVYIGLLDVIWQSAESFADMIAKLGKSQPETFDERISVGTPGEAVSGVTYTVYVNNTNSGTTFSSTDKYLDISSILSTYNLGDTEITSGDVATLKLYTAAGEVAVKFTVDEDKCIVSYSTDIDDQQIDSGDIVITDTRVYLTLAVIEDYLGYDIEYYDDFINIVTDNKDIVKAENVVTEGVLGYVDNTLDNNDTTKPADDPANVEAQKDIVEQQEKEQEEAEQNPYGDEYSDLTDDQYKEIGITPPGEEKPSTPATNSEGKTIEEIRLEAEAKSNEKIKNGEQGFNEENLKDAEDIVNKRAQELGLI